LKDGEVETACQAACSTGAIVFGDMNNPESRISKLLKLSPLHVQEYKFKNKEGKEETKIVPKGPEKVAGNPRAYQVISEIGVRPNIWYLAKVRNKEEAKA
jgi:molybdopterin-containing oxidoreductase family iron-sulfur binding subunit